jgi:hypothetical protein
MEWMFVLFGILVGVGVAAIFMGKAPQKQPQPTQPPQQPQPELPDAVTVILQNIAVYDGTARGQQEVPNARNDQ